MNAVPERIAKSTPPVDAKGKFVKRTPLSGVALPAPVIDEPEEIMEGPTISTGVKRVPLGQHVAKLALPPRPGFTRRWINDVPGRILKAQGGGYSLIEDDKGKPVTYVVDRQTGLLAYAMEIPNEFYSEDFAGKQESLDAVDKQIYGGTFNQEPGLKERSYVPTQIKLGGRRGSGRG